MNPRARAYYQRKRGEGKAHWPALRSLARYLCRIAFRMLSRGRTYQQVAAVPAAATPTAPVAPDLPVRSLPGSQQPADVSRGRPPDVLDVSTVNKLVPDGT
jgi:hypothetical protein